MNVYNVRPELPNDLSKLPIARWAEVKRSSKKIKPAIAQLLYLWLEKQQPVNGHTIDRFTCRQVHRVTVRHNSDFMSSRCQLLREVVRNRLQATQHRHI